MMIHYWVGWVKPVSMSMAYHGYRLGIMYKYCCCYNIMLKVQTHDWLTFAALIVQGVASICGLEARPALAVLAAPAALAVALADTLAPGHCGESRHQDDGVGNIIFFGGDKERDRVQCSVLCCLIHIIKVHLCLAPPTPSRPHAAV